MCNIQEDLMADPRKEKRQDRDNISRKREDEQKNPQNPFRKHEDEEMEQERKRGSKWN